VFVGADYPFLDVFWTMLVFFVWVIWIWLLITILIDVFRRHDIGGAKKVLWVIFVILVPFVGVFAYLLVNHDEMATRNVEQMKAQQAQFDSYVQTVAGSSGAAAEIEKAKQLLDSGAITQQEFDAIKQKALAA
jgi:signal transduction histidine kinase